jgi:hypothetical protein
MKPARVVEDGGDLLDVLVEETERRRVRQHQSCRSLVDELAQVGEIDVPACVGLHLRELVPRHRYARRIRTVRRIRRHHRVAFFATIGEVGAHQHQSGQLALRACRRL